MHNFVYLAQRRSQEFSCKPIFGGGSVPSASLAVPVALRVLKSGTIVPVFLAQPVFTIA